MIVTIYVDAELPDVPKNCRIIVYLFVYSLFLSAITFKEHKYASQCSSSVMINHLKVKTGLP